MRAAPGAVPRAIAQPWRRIDIAKNPSTAARVANKRESHVNPGAVGAFLVAPPSPSKGFCRYPARRVIMQPYGESEFVMPLNRLALVILATLPTVAPSAAIGQTLQEKISRDQTLWVPNDDADMAAAMQKARSTLADFLALADAPRPSTSLFGVKVGTRANEHHVEYFWISPFTRVNGRFSGRIDNEPELATDVKLGDTMTFGEDQIVDWLYLENGRLRGNFTACVLFRREPREQAEAAIAKYRMDCKL
jgi:uncharacterized protein YegJ (DUF2314 family)